MATITTQAADAGAHPRGVRLILAAVLAGGFAGSALACNVPKEFTRLSVPLPSFAAAVHDSAPLKIIAIGSSSTAGAGASNVDKSYPARLQAQLQAIWPDQNVRVINAGVNGQLATDMIARLDRDVLVKKPQLVIWQTGVNDAIRGVPLDTFKKSLSTGIERLRQARIDMLLIDQQYYPNFDKVKNGPLYIAAIRETAQHYRVPVIQRFQLMKHLVESKQFSMSAMLSKDGFHLSDTSYDCLGKVLAESLRGAATTTTIVEPVNGKRL